MALELVVIARALDSRVTLSPRESYLHRFLKELEALNIIEGLLGTLDIGEYDECLALRLQVRLGHDVDDLAIFGEELAQSLDQLRDLDPLFEVAHVQSRAALARVRVGVQ